MLWKTIVEKDRPKPAPNTVLSYPISKDAFGAAITTVIDEVVRVPSGTAGTHLGQSRPNNTKWAIYDEGVIHRADRLRD